MVPIARPFGFHDVALAALGRGLRKRYWFEWRAGSLQMSSSWVRAVVVLFHAVKRKMHGKTPGIRKPVERVF